MLRILTTNIHFWTDYSPWYRMLFGTGTALKRPVEYGVNPCGVLVCDHSGSFVCCVSVVIGQASRPIKKSKIFKSPISRFSRNCHLGWFELGQIFLADIIETFNWWLRQVLLSFLKMVQTTPTEATQALSSFWPKVTEEVKTLNNVIMVLIS